MRDAEGLLNVVTAVSDAKDADGETRIQLSREDAEFVGRHTDALDAQPKDAQ